MTDALKPGDLVIDFSGLRLNDQRMQTFAAAGGKGFVRYSAGAASNPGNPNHDSVKWKLITPNEYAYLIRHGDVIANDEWYESRIAEGAAAGQADAAGAATLWKSCGLPKGAAIIVSWDANPVRAKWSAARAYLLAYANTLKGYGYHLGVYAGTPFLKYAASGAFGRFVVRFLWRPNAGSWSNDGLPYQPDTSTPAARAALVQLALPRTPATLWQTGNYWFFKQADENIVVRVPVGSSLEAAAAQVTRRPPKPVPTPTPPPPVIDGKELILTPEDKAYIDASAASVKADVADLKAYFIAWTSDSSGKPHRFRTWLTKLSGKNVDLP